MLTIKVYDENGVRAGYACDSYKLVPPGENFAAEEPCRGENVHRVYLMDSDGNVRTIIRPSDTSTVYVMNDGGKTVDTMRFARSGLPAKGVAGSAGGIKPGALAA